MQRSVITIPQGFLRKISVDWDIDWRGQSLGDSNSGSTQTVYNRFPRWVGSPEVLLHQAEIGQWRAIRAQAQGRTGLYRVEMCDPAVFRFTDTGDQVPGFGIPFSDADQPFSSGQGFAYEPTCSAVSGASAGATSIRVEDADAVPSAGQIMSHNLWPFTVTYVTELGGGTYDLGVQMPLREAIPAGASIKLRGEGLFEAVEESMGRPKYGAGHAARTSLTFREVLNR